MDDQLLTVAEVAVILRLNPQTVRRWIRSGRLPAVNLGGGAIEYRIRQSEIARLLRVDSGE